VQAAALRQTWQFGRGRQPLLFFPKKAYIAAPKHVNWFEAI
jgi:hypothetical protein